MPQQLSTPARADAQAEPVGKSVMRLADFIEQRMPVILASWDSFAASLLPAAAGASGATLRDHSEQILQAVVQDLRTAQSPQQQAAKAWGQAMRPSHAGHTAAQTHAVLRATSGFTMQQMVAEYRALRTGVLQRWFEAHAPDAESLDDVIRFNEAIDQAVTESVDFFSREVDRWRNVFLAVLGHDLRGPLNAIVLSSQLIARLGEGPPVSGPAEHLVRSSARMKELIDDLLDYSRTALGMGLAIQPRFLDLANVCREEIEVQRAALPGCRIEFEADGATQGCWDASRMKQVVSNLVTNAARYGEPGGPVTVTLKGGEAELSLSVQNPGLAIPRDAIELLFEPLRRGAGAEVSPERTSMGLGLFIVRQVAQAHGGTVVVDSAHGRTIFTVVLPRWPHRALPEPAEGLQQGPLQNHRASPGDPGSSA